MRWGPRVLLGAAILALLPVSAVESASTAPHAPIKILGDDAFVAANGVTSGTGTVADPYKISRWRIYAPFDSGIWLRDTTKHVVIEQNHIAGAFFAGDYSAGIRMENVSNVTVRNNLLRDSQFGIHGKQIHHLTIQDNTITGIQLHGGLASELVISNGGIHLIDSSHGLVESNRIGQVGWGIIAEKDSHDLIMRGNEIEDIVFAQAIGLIEGPSNISISENHLQRGREGITVVGARDIEITANMIDEMDQGLSWQAYRFFGRFADMTNISVVGNTFSDSSVAAALEPCSSCSLSGNTFMGNGDALRIATSGTYSRNHFISNSRALVYHGQGDAVSDNNTFGPDNEIMAAVHDGSLDLRRNWWGSDAGPSPSKFHTTGSGTIHYSPWLTGPPE